MNKTTRSVRYRPPHDRRANRTQHSVVHALVQLVKEKRYDAITVQDLLDRANIGRSTFYAHYRGKDDLLIRSWEHMLEHLDAGMANVPGAPARVAPVRELFQHVGEATAFHQALARAHMLDRIYQAGANQLSTTIARRLSAIRQSGPEAVPLTVMAQAYAGSLFALLRWWVDHDMPYPPDRMDQLYHRLVLTG